MCEDFMAEWTCVKLSGIVNPDCGCCFRSKLSTSSISITDQLHLMQFNDWPRTDIIVRFLFTYASTKWKHTKFSQGVCVGGRGLREYFVFRWVPRPIYIFTILILVGKFFTESLQGKKIRRDSLSPKGRKLNPDCGSLNNYHTLAI